ncbi:MAG: alkaline phosphatase family protein [Endomicrobiaceae bacterium]|nr:alkaline phosphatase family protein [Endomicrobiaceae bacterium]
MKMNSIMLILIVMLVCLSACNGLQPIENPNNNNGNNNTREHASYYVEGIPLIEDAHVVYMNWDGFAYYYYDEFVRREVDNTMPTLKKLLSEGVIFENLRTTLPSITNPCQNMILSGSTSAITKNVYRYYDSKTNTVIQQSRENANKTIADVAVESGMSVASVSHYLLEPLLTKNISGTYYIVPDNTLPSVEARGSSKYGDGFSRFEQLIRLVKGETVNKVGLGSKQVKTLPKLIVLYIDDIDAVGHNETSVYGYKKAVSEEERMNNVLTLLNELDAKLGEFIQACKNKGIYDKMTFFLTTDHGMTPFGLSSTSDKSDYGNSKLGELKSFLKRYNSKFEFEMVSPNASPKAATTVVGVGANLNIQLTWKKGITDDELSNLKAALENEYYVGKVMIRKELSEAGYMDGAADMVISPSERYCFSKSLFATYIVRGQHDSMHDSSNRIYGIAWGKGIKKNYIYQETAYNYDLGVTMAASLGLVIPNANGVVLDIFER